MSFSSSPSAPFLCSLSASIRDPASFHPPSDKPLSFFLPCRLSVILKPSRTAHLGNKSLSVSVCKVANTRGRRNGRLRRGGPAPYSTRSWTGPAAAPNTAQSDSTAFKRRSCKTGAQDCGGLTRDSFSCLRNTIRASSQKPEMLTG